MFVSGIVSACLVLFGTGFEFPACPPGMEEVAHATEEALLDGDYDRISELVHPVHGLTLSTEGNFAELCDRVFSREAIPHLAGSQTKYIWGIGFDEQLVLRSFDEALEFFVKRDLRRGREVSVYAAETRKLNLSWQYSNPHFVGYLKPNEEGMLRSWNQVNVVFDLHSDGHWYLVALGYAHWTM